MDATLLNVLSEKTSKQFLHYQAIFRHIEASDNLKIFLRLGILLKWPNGANQNSTNLDPQKDEKDE